MICEKRLDALRYRFNATAAAARFGAIINDARERTPGAARPGEPA
jgi:hypothetical protein